MKVYFKHSYFALRLEKFAFVFQKNLKLPVIDNPDMSMAKAQACRLLPLALPRQKFRRGYIFGD